MIMECLLRNLRRSCFYLENFVTESMYFLLQAAFAYAPGSIQAKTIIPCLPAGRRGGPESAMLKGLTAEDVLKYEQEELGNKDVVPEPGIDLTKIKSENLAWLTETEDQAREYGEASKSDLKDYRVIARDSEGGVLVEKLKSSTEEPTSKGMAKAEMARVCQRRLKTYKMLGYEVRKFDEPLEHEAEFNQRGKRLN